MRGRWSLQMPALISLCVALQIWEGMAGSCGTLGSCPGKSRRIWDGGRVCKYVQVSNQQEARKLESSITVFSRIRPTWALLRETTASTDHAYLSMAVFAFFRSPQWRPARPQQRSVMYRTSQPETMQNHDTSRSERGWSNTLNGGFSASSSPFITILTVPIPPPSFIRLTMMTLLRVVFMQIQSAQELLQNDSDKGF